MTVTDASPLIKTRALTCSADQAFDVFVERMAEWWPLARHSVFHAESRGVVVEPGVAGRIVETGPDGEESVWGTLTDWEPRTRLAFTWHPGADAGTATWVQVTFTPEGEGSLLTLSHEGWERPQVVSTREGYDEGWPLVLEAYAGLVTR